MNCLAPSDTLSWADVAEIEEGPCEDGLVTLTVESAEKLTGTIRMLCSRRDKREENGDEIIERCAKALLTLKTADSDPERERIQKAILFDALGVIRAMKSTAAESVS